MFPALDLGESPTRARHFFASVMTSLPFLAGVVTVPLLGTNAWHERLGDHTAAALSIGTRYADS